MFLYIFLWLINRGKGSRSYYIFLWWWGNLLAVVLCGYFGHKTWFIIFSENLLSGISLWLRRGTEHKALRYSGFTSNIYKWIKKQNINKALKPRWSIIILDSIYSYFKHLFVFLSVCLIFTFTEMLLWDSLKTAKESSQFAPLHQPKCVVMWKAQAAT